VAYKGVFVSLNPRNTPCMANERRTAGAPSDLNVKYWSAGVSIGESYKKNIIVQCHYNGHTVIKIQVLDIQGK
jgi:hypothetical protein